MGATHDGAPRTHQWLKLVCLPWKHTGAYSISIFKTYLQPATTIQSGETELFLLHLTVVLNGIFCIEVPAGDAAGSNSTSPGGKVRVIQPFSKKSRTPTVAKEFQIGLHDPAEADLEHFWNCCSAGFLG